MQSLADVLYIHPTKQDVDFLVQAQKTRRRSGLWVDPSGDPGAFSMNVLRDAGIGVRGLNYSGRRLNRRFDLRRWLRTQTQARLVLVDMRGHVDTYGAISVANVVKEILQDARVVLGA